MGTVSTKSKTLAAAVEVFAERGFVEATAARISERSGANIAAINYHFGSKESLFKAAIEYAFDEAIEAYPMKPNPAMSPAKQLRFFISAIIRRTFDTSSAGYIDQIIRHELVREGGPHAHTVQEIQKHQSKVLRPILSKLLKTNSKRLIDQAHINIAALCFFPKVATPLRNMLFPKPPNETQLQAYIEGQFQFALAGLNSLNPSPSDVR